jgi:hypothetical protein
LVAVKSIAAHLPHQLQFQSKLSSWRRQTSPAASASSTRQIPGKHPIWAFSCLLYSSRA